MSKNEITSVKADIVNAACQKVGFSLRLECISPEDARAELSRNPALLKAYGLSQVMSGDKFNEDDTLEDADGRPFVDTLVYRIASGQWKTHFGIICRCPNGAVIDGVTRLIAISRGKEPVWVLTYNDADPKDFYMFDDEMQARKAKDVFENMGYPSEAAGILAIMVPKASGTTNDKDGEYTRVMRDRWYEFYKANRTELEQSVAFVRKERGERGVVRKNLTALVHWRFVARKEAKNKAEALRLLTAYKTRFANTKEERALVDLQTFFTANHHLLHERTACMPLFYRVMRAALRGEELKYRLKEEAGPNGRPKFSIEYPVKKSRSKAKV